MKSLNQLDAVNGAPAPFVIDPRKSKWLPYWDGTTFTALIFTAILTPYEVAFLPPGIPGWFVINRLVDLIFIIGALLRYSNPALPARHLLLRRLTRSAALQTSA